MISADGWSATGREHEAQGGACQDAHSAGFLGARSLACVSDGCSGVEGSELGAMALSRSALALFQEGADFYSLPEIEALRLILARAEAAGRSLGFELAQRHATLILICHDGLSGTARALIWGDGYVGRSRDGALSLMESRSAQSAPFYPAYALTPGAEDYWSQQGGSQTLAPDGFCEGIEALPGAREAWLDFAPGDLIFASTDGAARAGELSARAALEELLRIKSWAGRFLRRRMSRARKDWESAAPEGSPFRFEDDFTLAALRRAPASDASESA